MMTKMFLIIFPKHFLILNRQTNPHTQVEHYRFAVSVLVMVSLALLYGSDFTGVRERSVSAEETIFCRTECRRTANLFDPEGRRVVEFLPIM